MMAITNLYIYPFFLLFVSFLFLSLTPARLLNVAQESWFQNDTIDPQYPHRRSSVLDDITAATFLDVAVVRCLFIPRWCEEGVHWALQFLFYRYPTISIAKLKN